MKSVRFWLLVLILLLSCISLVACTPRENPTAGPISVPAVPTVTTAVAQPTAISGPTIEPGFIITPVFVDEIEIFILESFPVQVLVGVEGNLATPCSQISHTQQTVGPDNLIILDIFSKQEADAFCAQVLAPFEESFSLDVLGLPAGTYQVSVNGVVGEFTLLVDNE